MKTSEDKDSFMHKLDKARADKPIKKCIVCKDKGKKGYCPNCGKKGK